jgi:threonine synthase
MKFEVVCNRCGKKCDKNKWDWRCSCGGAFDIVCDLKGKSFVVNRREESMKRYAEFLPVDLLPEVRVGWTPTIRKNIEGVNANFKLEYLNPGGSFKDRGAWVSMAKALELGSKGVVVDSSGNSAIGFALMGLVSGIEAHVFVPARAPRGKINLLKLLKARIHTIKGDRMEVNQAALDYESNELLYMGHWWNPYFLEGVKTMAYESYEQMGSVDYVFSPVGSGSLLLGLYKGFRELVELGALRSMPRIMAVQAGGYSKVCRELGASDLELEEKSKLADGIAIEDPPRRDQIVRAVKDTGGSGMIINDREIKESLIELRRSGFIVEPTSAVVYAAFKKSKSKSIPRGSKVLLPLTGSGLKVIDDLVEIEIG